MDKNKKIENSKYKDEFSEIHCTLNELGRGGQGVVYRTNDPDLAIKLVTDQNGNPIDNKKICDKLIGEFRKLYLLPYPKNFPISLPLSVLKDFAGYVMPLANDMKPLSSLFSGIPKNKKIPNWLEKMDNKGQIAFMFYSETGSSKERMNFLYKIAVQLTRLHTRALIYGDISPNNIFYSNHNNSIFFIDADNLCLESNKTKIVYTPRYGALELIENKSGISSQSDVWAFAVFAYELLTMNYPFSALEDSGADNWENTNNSSNQKEYDYSKISDNGIPTMLILSKKLITLFQQTLIDGRENRLRRPQMFEFATELSKTTDILIQCHNEDCKMSYFFDYIEDDNGKHQCPYCGTKRSELILIESFNYTIEKGDLTWRYVINEFNQKTIIPRRVFSEFLMENSDDEVLQISFEDNFIILKNLQEDISLHIATKNKPNFEKIYTQIKIDKSIDHEFFLFVASECPRFINIKILEEQK